jgi:hypothetical protein
MTTAQVPNPKKPMKNTLLICGMVALAGCQQAKEAKEAGESQQENISTTFGQDADFLKAHTDAVILKRGDAAIAVVPEYQGRVMTATARGDAGASSGWINHELIKQGVEPPDQQKGKLDEHMYAFGGEERFWMGPEGGQYSIFFAPEKPFDFKHWFTPDAIDNEPWQVVSQKDDEIVLAHDFQLLNHSGTRFEVGAERTVRLLDSQAVAQILGKDVPSGLDMVAYQSVNTIRNKGSNAWQPDSGLLSIWILSMLQHSDTTTVFIPIKTGPVSELGAEVNADYFGTVPPDRLQTRDGMIYFKCDGKQRGKIGVTPERSTGMAGSYDPVAGRVTLMFYNQPDQHEGYVNSMWELQEHPYKGDAINSYNDGPVDDSGEQMGPFYEIESSSPALALAPGEAGTHVQTIIHLYGSEADLQQAVSAAAPVDLATVKSIFAQE